MPPNNAPAERRVQETEKPAPKSDTGESKDIFDSGKNKYDELSWEKESRASNHRYKEIIKLFALVIAVIMLSLVSAVAVFFLLAWAGSILYPEHPWIKQVKIQEIKNFAFNGAFVYIAHQGFRNLIGFFFTDNRENS